jgi:ATP-binding cassette subfamily F protein 3
MIVNNLVKDIGGKKLLNNVSFILNKGDKVALVGINGCGKSTLLKIIKGIIPYDDGSINFNNEDVSLLKQEIAIDDYNISVLDYVKRETNIKQTELKLHELENSLNDQNMEEYGSVLESYLKLDGYNFDNNLSVILNGLNFNSSLDVPISTLSGGQKIKVLLSIVLLSNAEIMLLDEPTNNLDIEAIE